MWVVGADDRAVDRVQHVPVPRAGADDLEHRAVLSSANCDITYYGESIGYFGTASTSTSPRDG
jgi:hypothetical protein